MDTETSNKRLRTRELNDALRCRGEGGQVLITRGIASLGDAAMDDILQAIAAFDDFKRDNDPYEKHDCAVLMVADYKIIWKIDYYDATLTVASPDPSDSSATRRVMTVMLAEEY